MKERKMRFQVGLMSVAAISILGIMIFYFGNTPRWLRRGTEYAVDFPEAPGINPGAPVKRSGIRVGQVVRVDLDEQSGHVLLTLSLEQPYRLRRHEVPTITTGFLANDASIELVSETDPRQKDPDKSEIDPAEVVLGKRGGNVSALINRASEFAPMTQELMMDLKRSMEKIEKLTPQVEATLEEIRLLAKQSNDAFPAIFEDTRKAISSFEKTARSVEQSIPEFKKLATETVTEYQKLAKDLRDTIPTLRDNANTAITEIRDLAKAGREFMPDLKKATEEITATIRVFGRLGERGDVWFQANQQTITRTIDALRVDLEKVGELLSPENQKQFSALVKNLRVGSDRIEEIGKNAETALRDAGDVFRRIVTFINDFDQGATVNAAGKQAMGKRLGSILKNLDESLEKVNGLMGDARELVRVAGQADGTLQRFITDPGLYTRINEILDQGLRQIPRIERILHDAETFADKLARHPELLGVGGAVRPGNGLKDPPETRPNTGPGFPPVPGMILQPNRP